MHVFSRKLEAQHVGIILASVIPLLVSASAEADWGFLFRPPFTMGVIVALLQSTTAVLMRGPDSGQRNRRKTDEPKPE